ncbi:hypothetical protein Gotri_025666 [Gossypium trilobum]|uniref:DUF4283 domain-containing protein n=1 Tax=Gossypium trilobum TaxID=34281 RepID=A0A7J9FQU9_9ROSI|nr:hypothetical protein [Gossypium trilobum]
MVEPNEKPTLICTIWTEKSYNLDSFKAQMKSIWKTKRKFEIQSVGQNLFMIVFELEEDLETVMEGMHSSTTCKKDRIRENPPFSLALKAELNLVERESLKFNALAKKLQLQCSYTGGVKENQEMYLQSGKSSGMIQEVQEDSWVKITEKETRTQNVGEVDDNKSEKGKTDEDSIKPARKSS